MRRFRNSLVVVEIALACVLLSGSGLLLRSVGTLQDVDPGMNPRGLAMMQVNLPASYATPEARMGFFQELSGQVRTLPGVQSVSHTEDPPMGSNLWYPWVWREGDEERQPKQAAGHAVGADYFETLGMKILKGRPFQPRDDERGQHVIVVNETMAREVWPNEDPIGKRLNFGPNSEQPAMVVVGVSRAIRQTNLTDEGGWEMYVPYAQRPESPRAYILARSLADPMSLATAMGAAVWEIDPNLPIPEFTSMLERVDSTLHLPRLRALLLGLFAFLALLIAAAGVYGTMLYLAGRRTLELGIRMALGARREEVVGMVVREGSHPVAIGLVVGLGMSLMGARIMGSLLFGVSPYDLVTYGLVAALLGGMAMLANLVPAWRAARSEPARVFSGD